MSKQKRRPIEQARAIAKALRQRYIPQEAELAAQVAFARLEPTPSNPADTGSAPHRANDPTKIQSRLTGSEDYEPTMIAAIREREGIALAEERPFTEAERSEARALLAQIQARYAVKH